MTRATLLSCSVMLLQTKRAVREIQAAAARAEVVWFSTYVEPPVRASDPVSHGAGAIRCHRFVFLGHLWRTKGIETLLESAASLPRDCTIDIYGPTDEYSAEEIDGRGLGRVRYCGFLSHEQVAERLWEYDCLVLPTFHPGEGYPGVIAEAFAHGLPVISTNWLAIPEIVDEECGILIEPQNTAALHRGRCRSACRSAALASAARRAPAARRSNSITRHGRASSNRFASRWCGVRCAGYLEYCPPRHCK